VSRSAGRDRRRDLFLEVVRLPFELVESRDRCCGETGPYRLSHPTSYDELLRSGETTFVRQCAGVVAVARSDDEE
jgi:Fe-S oxidoreductase